MTPEEIAEMQRKIRFAIADPGAFLPREEYESVPQWSMRAVMTVIEDEAIDRMAETFVNETRLRSMDFRNGMSMDLEPSRALVANWVGVARGMLGDAENYCETPIEMTVGLAPEPDATRMPERYVFILQRAGKLTPHQARLNAEAEVEKLKAEVERLREGIATRAARLLHLGIENPDDLDAVKDVARALSQLRDGDTP